ncbi:MAG: hypothetical protein LQ346_000528 [Caloplaca aetnensis]|nr:MAG: hypothetical protein LQ346_000528 [Caloplaca aetnensis]
MPTLRHSNSAPAELGVPTYCPSYTPSEDDDSDDLRSLFRHGTVFLHNAGDSHNANDRTTNPGNDAGDEDQHANAEGAMAPSEVSGRDTSLKATDGLSLYYEDPVTGRIKKRAGMFNRMDPRHPANVAQAAWVAKQARLREEEGKEGEEKQASKKPTKETEVGDKGEEGDEGTGSGVATEAEKTG